MRTPTLREPAAACATVCPQDGHLKLTDFGMSKRLDMARGDGFAALGSLPGLFSPSAFLNSPGILLPLYVGV